MVCGTSPVPPVSIGGSDPGEWALSRLEDTKWETVSPESGLGI